MKLCPSERRSSPHMPGEALRDGFPALTAAAALYGWVILQIGDTVDLRRDGRHILCSGKPAMTLAREDSSKVKIDLLYIPWPITPERLVERLAAEMRRALDDVAFHASLTERVRGQY